MAENKWKLEIKASKAGAPWEALDRGLLVLWEFLELESWAIPIEALERLIIDLRINPTAVTATSSTTWGDYQYQMTATRLD